MALESRGAVDGSRRRGSRGLTRSLAVHVEAHKRGVDGFRRDAEGTRGAVEGSKLLKELYRAIEELEL